MSEEKDNESRIALLIISALIAATVIGVVWFGASTVLKRNKNGVVATAPVAVVTETTAVVTSGSDAVVVTETSVGVSSPGAQAAVGSLIDLVKPSLVGGSTGATFLFKNNSAEVPSDAESANILNALVNVLKQGGSATITAFNGQGETMAAAEGVLRSRAQAVHDLLVRLGAPTANIQLANWEVDQSNANRFEAQRVEVLLNAVPASGTVPVTTGSIVDAPVTIGASTASQANAVNDAGPRVVVEGGIVKFYFAVGQSELAAGASDALLDVIAAVASGKRAVISGFTDASGSIEVNEELSKKRAFAVRDTLLSLGVPEDRIEMLKPEAQTGTGAAAEARRVEVRLAD